MGFNDHTGKYKSTPAVPAGKPATSQGLRFADYYLNTQEQAECKAWEPDAADVLAAFNRWVQDDTEAVRIAWDSRGECFMAQWYFLGSSGDKLCLVGRGSTPAKAIKQLAYLERLADGLVEKYFGGGLGKKSIDD